MSFYKRIWISIERNQKKAIILFVMLFILGTLISGALLLRQAKMQSVERLWLNTPRLVSLTRDIDALAELMEKEGLRFFPDPDFLTPAIIDEIGSLPQVEFYQYAFYHPVIFENLVFYEAQEDLIRDFYEWSFRDRYRDHHAFGITDNRILGFQTGLISLVEGRGFQEGDLQAALISDEFALLNHLTVGSIMTLFLNTLDEPFLDSPLDESILDSPLETFEVEVIGIFQLNQDFATGHGVFDNHRREQVLNQFYFPLEFTKILHEQGFQYASKYWGDLLLDLFGENWTLEDSRNNFWQFSLSEQSAFVLYDLRDLAAFRAEAAEILPFGWRIHDYSEVMFPQMLRVLENLNDLTLKVLQGTIAAAFLITGLLVFLYLRDTKKEIGIYLALGEGKLKIFSRLLGEVLTITTAALTFSVFSGHVISDFLTKTFLQNELMSQGFNRWEYIFTNELVIGGNGSPWRYHLPGFLSFEEMMSTFDVSFGAYAILLLYGIGLLVAALAIAAASFYIWKLPAKDILAK